jgi:hypothetical protein
MCRISFLVLIVASTAVTWSDSQAAGSFQTKPTFQDVVTASVAAQRQPFRCPTHLRAISLVAAVGVASAIPKPILAAVRPIEVSF